jgi:DNA-binding NtrC family response regulator
MERPLALVVDRDPGVRALIRDVLEQKQVVALDAASGTETMDVLRTRAVSILMVDSAAPGVDAIELVRYAQRLRPQRIYIGIAPSDSSQESCDLVSAGAFDVVGKPLDQERLRQVVERALRHHALLEELRGLREGLQPGEGYLGLVGRSAAMERLRERLQRLAASEVPVCFSGELGTGKELAARTLHRLSRRRDEPFVIVPCANLSARAWEAQWGGAAGFLAEVRAGSLYLDDLPALDLELQERLIDTLALAGRGGRPQARILFSSTRDPGVAVEEGRLLEDLAGPLAAETVHLPPLRDRVEDVPVLARYFIETISTVNQLPSLQITPDALDLLEHHAWPENVQELRNALEQAVILSSDGTIRSGDLPERIRPTGSTPGRAEGRPDASRGRFREAKRAVVEEFERSYLVGLMGTHAGNVTAAAHQAGMLRSALQRLLRKYGLKSAEFRRRRPQGREQAPRPPR